MLSYHKRFNTITNAVLGLTLLVLARLQTIAATVTIDDAKACNAGIPPIDFILYKGDANAEAIEDELREDLEKIGLTIQTRLLARGDFDEARYKGDFGLSFSEGWGAPYDPHSFVSSWEAENLATHHALENIEAPASIEELLVKIEDVLQEEDISSRQAKWNEVHDYYHQQAVMLPLWGRRVVAIINSRLSGYVPGQQQFDFPVQRLVPISGSKTVTISPGSQTGRFETVGEIDPHT
jgi:ABC-type transport system substrate-binding protein